MGAKKAVCLSAIVLCLASYPSRLWAQTETYVFVAQWGSYGSGNGQLIWTRGIAVAGSGRLFAADPGNNRIQKFTSEGVYLRQWGTLGSGNGQFRAPYDVAVDADGIVYVSDTGNNRIQKFTSEGVYLTQWGTEGTGAGQLDAPFGLAVGAGGIVYVVDYSNRRIQKFTSEGVYLTQWSMGNPRNVAVDADGNVYVSDESCCIQKFTSEGVYLTQWPVGHPDGVAVDAEGNVYVSDFINKTIQKFTSEGVYLTQWGTEGTGAGQFSYPSGIAVDAGWNVYVVDANDCRIQRFAARYPLGIYADDAATDRQLCAEQNVPSYFYLQGLVPAFAPPGVKGAEFRIEVTNPAGYLFTYTPPNGASAYGSPFDLTPADPNDPAGTVVLFSSCQPPSPQPDSLVDFGRVGVLNFAGGATTLRIRAKQPPDDPSMPCPRYFMCNAPINTPVCIPALRQDIVYEVLLNPQSCQLPPLTTEDLPLDTQEVSNDGSAGPVFTDHVLGRLEWFLITVQGTVSLTDSSTWISPPGAICGIPELMPQYPSPGVHDFWVGADAEINFAAALPPGSDCDSLESQGYPRHHARFQVDLGSGFTHLEPLGGAPTDPAPSHRYRFLVQGQDNLASFRWEEAQTSDNYGVLSIRVEEVNPTDVDAAVESTPRPNKVIMLASVPNPFNPTTVIRYILPHDSDVTVEVYDIRGRAVRRLFSGPQRGGYQSVIWDGRLDSGSRAPSSTYFAHVTTPVGSTSERMTLVK